MGDAKQTDIRQGEPHHERAGYVVGGCRTPRGTANERPETQIGIGVRESPDASPAAMGNRRSRVQDWHPLASIRGQCSPPESEARVRYTWW